MQSSPNNRKLSALGSKLENNFVKMSASTVFLIIVQVLCVMTFYTTRIEKTHFKPGNFSRFNNTNHLEASTTEVNMALEQLLNCLEWKRFTILYEKDDILSTVLTGVHDGLKLTSVSVLRLPVQLNASFTGQLLQLHEDKFPNLYFIVLGTYDTALKLLTLVEATDEISIRRTDFRHQSFWIVVCSDGCQPSTSATSALKQLENVFMVSMTDEVCTERCYPSVYTLHVAPEGRIFAEFQLTTNTTEDELFPNTKYGLNNRTFVISVLQWPEMILKNDKTGKYEGYLVNIIEGLVAVLNFSYEIVEPADQSYGLFVNGTWDGLIGQLERREIDMAVAVLSVNEDREKVMDFLLPPTFSAAEDFIYRLEDQNTQWTLYLQPIEPLGLVTLFISFVTFTFILVMLAGWDVHTEQPNMKNKQTKRLSWTLFRIDVLKERVFYTFAILLNRGESYRPNSWTLRILLFTWGFFSLVFATTFSAKLVSFLAVQKQKLPFSTLSQMVEQTEYKWGILAGDISQYIFENSKSGDMKGVWDGIKRFHSEDPGVLSTNESVHLAKVFGEKYAFLTVRSYAEMLRSRDCQLRILGEDVIWHQLAIGVPSLYPLKRHIESVLSRMRDGGLFEIWWQQSRIPYVSRCDSDTSAKVLGIHDVQMAFYILCLGVGISLSVLSMEAFTRRARMKVS